MKPEEVLKWAAISGAVYLVYQLVNKVTAVGDSAADMYNQTAEVFDFTADPTGVTFVSWYDPTQRPVLFYWLTFPDGNHHFVWSSDVNAQGFLTYDGDLYRLGVDKSGGIRAYAVASSGSVGGRRDG